MEKQLIRAKDYLPVKPELAEGTTDEPVNETDGLTTRLFGAAPDYTQKEYEDLWQAVFNADEKGVIRASVNKTPPCFGGVFHILKI